MTLHRYINLCLTTLLVLAIASCGKNQDDSSTTPEPSIFLSDHISNQNVKSIAEDRFGQIWLGTFRGLNKFDGVTYHQYFCTNDSLGLPDNNISCVYRAHDGRLWVATVNGLCIYDGKESFNRVKMTVDNNNILSIMEDSKGRMFFFTITQIYKYNKEKNNLSIVNKNVIKNKIFSSWANIDDRDVLWVRTPFDLTGYSTSDMRKVAYIPLKGFPTYSGLANGHYIWLASNQNFQLFDTHTQKFLPIPTALATVATGNDNVYNVYPYNKDELLLMTARHGLWLYNGRTHKLINQSESAFPFDAPDFAVTSIFKDSHGNLWMGSDHSGYKVIYRYKNLFNTEAPLMHGIGKQAVQSVATDRKDLLWIATKDNGVFVYDLKANTLNNVMSNGSMEEGRKDEVSRIFVDKSDFVWLAMPSGVIKCQYNGNRLTALKSYNLGTHPMDITQDSKGNIIIGTTSVFLFTISPDGNMSRQQLYPQTFTFTCGLLPMHNGDVLVTSFMEPIMTINGRTGTLQKLPISQEDIKNCIRLSTYIPTRNFQDNKGNLWLGTVTNGLLHYDIKSKRMKPVEGLSCSDISSIEEDNDGNLWVSTMDGLNRIDGKDGQVTIFHESDGIGGFQFYDRASCRLADGTLVFGGTHGLTIFNPRNISVGVKGQLLFENLKVHNEVVIPGPDAPIKEAMETAKDIHLDYKQNSFSISFVAIDYSDYKRIHYYYRLKGHDDGWTDADGINEAYFSNLPAGNYTFQVKIASNASGKTLAERSINVSIAPEPWRSWWAICLYIIIAAVIGWFMIRQRKRIAEEKRLAQKAEDAREQEQRINKMNMSFFANISHEFRTPLTMISGPVEQLRDSREIKPHDKRLLDIISRSVQRMLRLVNQLLDFNKLENDTLQLHVSLIDVVKELRQCLDIFTMNAEEKGITINLHGIEGTLLMWLDADKLEKIINNLMSNAMKFTPRGGCIDVTLDTVDNGKYVKITVADTGKGLPENELENIFKRYYQLNNQSKGIVNWGSGIGLYYARALAKLHHGSLVAGNRKEGKGAVFTLTLPTSDSAYTEAEKAKLEDDNKLKLDKGKAENISNKHNDLTGIELQDDTEEYNRPKILIVDDDTEVVHYLRTLLATDYKVVYRFDAESALKAAHDEDPNIIISDVVMPGMSGYELCRQIKDDLQTSHIPVILVTAKNTDENKVEGLESGADAYVTKPFAPKVLLAQVKSLLINRERAKTILNSATETDKEVEDVLSPQDKRFMDDLYKVMEEEMANAELDVNKVTEKMHVSRTKLYYKVKGLTGEKPSIFFKTYKLNKAAALIKEGEYNISEIAFMTGFNTLSHFSTSFKRQFGCSPSEYGKKKY